MPYYSTGDYYGRGDYYRGDGIFSAIGRLAGTAVRAGLGILSGGAVGGAAGGLKGAVTGAALAIPAVVSSESQRAVLMAGGSESALTPELIAQHAAAVARGGAMPPMIMGPGGVPMLMGGGMELMTMRGYRPNKSTYAVRGGGTSRWGPAGMIRLIAKGTVPVKSRRMNVANPKALRRGLRRAAGFVKLARRAHVRLAAFTSKGRRKKK